MPCRLRGKTDKKQSIRAQQLLEYTMLLAVIVGVIMAIGPMFKRGIQAVVKLTADQIGSQQNAEQKVSIESGYLVNQYSSTDFTHQKDTEELLGAVTYTYGDRDTTYTESFSNLGFRNQE